MRRLDGLILLVDACHSGSADTSRWIRAAQQLGIRWQLLTSTDEEAAFDACFTKALIDDLRNGVSSQGPTLRCELLRYGAPLRRCVAVTGEAGQGKSTLAAALARPQRSAGRVPHGFGDAIVFVSWSSTPGELARCSPTS